MTIKINGTAQLELEKIILQKIAANRQKRPDVWQKLEKKDNKFLNFIRNILKSR